MAKELAISVQATYTDTQNIPNNSNIGAFAELSFSGRTVTNANKFDLTLDGTTSAADIFAQIPGMTAAQVVILLVYATSETTKTCTLNPDAVGNTTAGDIWAGRITTSLTITVDGTNDVDAQVFYWTE